MTKELETRKCVLSGEVKSKEELLRFVLLRDGTMIPDFDKKIDGHGFYVSNSKKTIEDLMQKNHLGKILHTKVTVPQDLAHTVETVLCQKCLNMINLARKAGCLVMGFEKVKEILSKDKAAFVIEACDSGEDGKQKIRAMAQSLNIYTLFDVATLSQTLNRENTVYLAVTKGPLGKSLETALQRYDTYSNA
ncbi:MAG: DUF448 domain-containing protein [Alphaproteobacteria bacterium]|nr:DUF448 domain-containing protein [Alphaproteobacteria bacterium]